MEDIKNIEIISENIKKLKSSIRINRIFECMSLTNIAIIVDALHNYGSELEIYSKLIYMATAGVCLTVFCISAENVKAGKFKIDELKFEIEKLELADKSR